ncbi:MAG: hypothetical protein WB998_11635 [Solirubrobacteraceae bacterium]
MAQTTLQPQDERMKPLVDVVSELVSMDEPRKRIAGLISGLDIHYVAWVGEGTDGGLREALASWFGAP